MLGGAGSRFNTLDRRLPFGRDGVSRSSLIAASSDGGASRPIHQPCARAAPIKAASWKCAGALRRVHGRSFVPTLGPMSGLAMEPAVSTSASMTLVMMLAHYIDTAGTRCDVSIDEFCTS